MTSKRIPTPGSKIAVVGSGIAGLSSAWLLAKRYDVSLYEAGPYFGGHSNTVDVTLEGLTSPVDTGFLVHNDLTYPNLIALFDYLQVPVHASEMSFAVSLEDPDIEWAGSSLLTVFAQTRNLIRPAFWTMLRDIVRFNRSAHAYLEQSLLKPLTLGELLRENGYSESMQRWYLLPMAAAIWSSSVKDILQFPAQTFLRFCLNHRLLQIEGRPQWRTVLGGSRVYVQAMLPDIQNKYLNCPVSAVRRSEHGVQVQSVRGTEDFAAVVMASHPPTSLGLLDVGSQEESVLGAFRYQPNRAVLHTDVALMPRRSSVWSAWNYMAQTSAGTENAVAVSYWLNRLQPLPFKQPVVVTLNSLTDPDPRKVIAEFDYEHPVMDQHAIRGQEQLPAIQGQQRTWFCGAWCGYGFHEDGLRSALAVAADFGIKAPWEASQSDL